MLRITFVIAFICQSYLLVAQFAPQVGLPNHEGILPKDLSGEIWASHAELSLGKEQIDNPQSPLVYQGGNYVTGPVDNYTQSLGDGGSATLFFDYALKNGSGNDLVVFENGFRVTDTLAFLELATVSISSDGKNFFRIPCQSLTVSDTVFGSFGTLDASKIDGLAGKYIAPYGVGFDFNTLKDVKDLDIDNIIAVKIEDVIGSTDPKYATFDDDNRIIIDPFPTPFISGGFDLDAVAGLYPTQIVSTDTRPTAQAKTNRILVMKRARALDKFRDGYYQWYSLTGVLLGNQVPNKQGLYLLKNTEDYTVSTSFIELTN